MYSYECEPYEA